MKAISRREVCSSLTPIAATGTVRRSQGPPLSKSEKSQTTLSESEVCFPESAAGDDGLEWSQTVGDPSWSTRHRRGDCRARVAAARWDHSEPSAFDSTLGAYSGARRDLAFRARWEVRKGRPRRSDLRCVWYEARREECGRWFREVSRHRHCRGFKIAMCRNRPGRKSGVKTQ